LTAWHFQLDLFLGELSSMYFLKKLNVLAYAAFILFVSSQSTNALDLKSNVIILMDFSNSYFTKSRLKKTIPSNFKKIAEVIGSKKNGPKRPSLVQVFPINDKSQEGQPVCEFLLLRKKLIGGGNKKKKCEPFKESLCSSKVKYFKNYINKQCVALIKKVPEFNATDISGALSLAASVSESQTDKSKYMVIFSDMFEYRDDKIPVTKINLKGFHVFVVCGGEVNEEDKSGAKEFCQDSEVTWKPLLKKMGAKSVKYVLETGNWNLKAARDFFDNE
jgi:hypothetical protein